MHHAHAAPTAARTPVLRGFVLACFALCCGAAAAQDSGDGFVTRTFVDAAGAHRYGLFVPSSPPPPGGYPVVLFLHGAAERGTDGVRPTRVGLGAVIRGLVREGAGFPAVAVFPQVEDPDGRILTAWRPDGPAGARALAILEAVEREFPTDPSRRLLTGWSMGAYGVAAQLAGDPGRWSAAVLVSGGRTADVSPASLAAATGPGGVPLWMVGGAKDRYVPFRRTAELAAEIRAAGGSVSLSRVPDRGHDVWKNAFASGVFAGLIADPSSLPVDPRIDPDAGRSLDLDPAEAAGPFVPALEVTGAAFVRADDALLSKLSAGLPDVVPADSLAGSLGTQRITQSIAGADVNVTFRDVRYSARLSGASVTARAGNVLTLRLEVSDAELVLGSTRLTAPLGHRGSASAIAVRVGRRRPVPLEIDVRPGVVDRAIKLKPLRIRFDLPADDYTVCGPRYVDERGLFLTEACLARILVKGLYKARPEVEAKIREFAPRIVAELEKRLDFGQPGGLADGLVPLPTVDPGVRVWPQAVRADAGGLTVLFGASVAAWDPADAPAQPLRADGGLCLDGDCDPAVIGRPPPARGLAEDRGTLAVGVATGLVRPLTAALVRGGLPRIDVRDVPGDPLRELARPASLAAIVPELARDPGEEVRARIGLAGPIAAAAAGRPGNRERAELVLTTDDLAVSIDRRVRGDWERVADLRFTLRQGIVIFIAADGSDRALAAGPAGRAEVEPAGVESPYEVDADLAARLVADGWDRWVEGEGPFGGTLEDIPVLGTRLRAESLTTTGRAVVARFGIPGTVLENRSVFPLTYRVKAGDGPWGGPFTLAPGVSHTYDARGPLRFEPAGTGLNLSARALPPGSVHAFRPPPGGGPPALAP